MTDAGVALCLSRVVRLPTTTPVVIGQSQHASGVTICLIGNSLWRNDQFFLHRVDLDPHLTMRMRTAFLEGISATQKKRHALTKSLAKKQPAEKRA